MKVGDQVIVRQSRAGAVGANVVKVLRMGNIMSINGNKAEVSMSSPNPAVSRTGGLGGSSRDINQSRVTVPLDKLELASSRFGGRTVVQVDPNKRGIGQLLQK